MRAARPRHDCFLCGLDQAERVNTLKNGVGLGLLVGLAHREGPSGQGLGFGIPFLMIEHSGQLAVAAGHDALGVGQVGPDLLDRHVEPFLGLDVIAFVNVLRGLFGVAQPLSQRIQVDALSTSRVMAQSQVREKSRKIESKLSRPLIPEPSIMPIMLGLIFFSEFDGDEQGRRFLGTRFSGEPRL